MKFTLRHHFEVDLDTFWEKVFFDEEYNRRLYLEELGFLRWELREQKEEEGGVKTRRVFLEPKQEAPAVVMKLVGGSFSYVEKGRFDPVTKRYAYSITTSALADKISIAGEYWLEPRGDRRVERFCTVDAKVKIFGVGGIVEGFIEKATRADYEKTAVFTQAFIREKGI